MALEQVPDEAFASKAVGDGIAEKPTSNNIVVAPAAGTVVKIFNTQPRVLPRNQQRCGNRRVHMGIDTVALKGARASNVWLKRART
ncbi:PTS glucose transporter subunit IIA [Klebsiella pneumoniae]|nr:PTS glucose transporter subunit IIA [Klebsiella pneumoniae]